MRVSRERVGREVGELGVRLAVWARQSGSLAAALFQNGPNGLFTETTRVRTIEHMFETATEPAIETANETGNATAGPWSDATVSFGSVSTDFASAPAASGSVTSGLVASGYVSFDIAFAQLANAVASIDTCGVPTDAGVLVGLRSQIDRLSALITEAEVRFNRNQLWRDEGAGSLRAWLVDACGLSRREATHLARRADRLESWPEVLEAWKSGALSGTQVDVVIAAVPARFVTEFAQQSPEVVRVLAPLDVAQTEVAMRQWVRCAEAADGAEDFSERPSGVYLDSLLDGRVVVQGQLNRTEAAIVEAALRVFDVPDSVDENGEFIGEPRSLGKRNADALVEVCKFALSHREGAGESGRFVPHVSLVVDIAELRASALRGSGVRSKAGLERAAEARGWSAAETAWFTDALHRHGDAVTADGSELDATALATLTCDSVVQRVLMAGSKMLNLGREVRTATASQRRAIVARDRHCRAPGCRTKPKHCDVHHIDHWINGGRTDVDRMVLLCGTHHREFHKPGYRMELSDQAEFIVHSPKGWCRSSVPERVETQIFPRSSGSDFIRGRGNTL